MAYAVSEVQPATATLTRLAAFRARHPRLVQLIRFTAVGGAGTLLNAAIFLLLRTWWETLPANLAALVLSTAIGTELNRHFTFSASRGSHRWRAHVQNGGTVLFYAFYSSAVLLALGLLVTDPSPVLESVAVAVASVLGGLLRFLVMRYWVFPD